MKYIQFYIEESLIFFNCELFLQEETNQYLYS